MLPDSLCYAFGASPHHARDGSCSLWRLVGQREALLDIAHFVGVLARGRRVESDACPSVFAVLLAGVVVRAAGEATRRTANGCANVPLALLREPPEYTRCDCVDVSSSMLGRDVQNVLDPSTTRTATTMIAAIAPPESEKAPFCVPAAPASLGSCGLSLPPL